MKKNILIATHNINKVSEIAQILNKNDKYNFISLRDLADNDDVLENGETFFDNALLKANYYYNKYNYITLADDSGLVIKSLDGKPGVHSKRFSTEETDYSNNLTVLKMLDELDKSTNREAYFETVVVLINENGIASSFSGKMKGIISNEIKGSKGFGYDPIFIPAGYNKTLGELGIDVKNKISHRAIAFKKAEVFINENINNK